MGVRGGRAPPAHTHFRDISLFCGLSKRQPGVIPPGGGTLLALGSILGLWVIITSFTMRPAIKKIVDELNPEKIILFGSFAYGTPTPHSDVDLLVIMDTSASNKDRSWTVSRLLLPRPFPVDILVKTPKEIEQDFESGDFFVREILTRGKVLYERSQ